MTRRAKIAVIVASTRETRFGEKPARWIAEQAAKRDWDVELLDLRDFDLPFFNEVASNRWAPSKDPHAVAWQNKLAEFDGFIFVTAEYNRSIPAALKNALDQAYVEWNRKPGAVVGYGSTGAARAIEHLRSIMIELQMVPVQAAVHIMADVLSKVHPKGQNGEMTEIADFLAPTVKAMLEDLDWWVRATRAAREEEIAKAA